MRSLKSEYVRFENRAFASLASQNPRFFRVFANCVDAKMVRADSAAIAQGGWANAGR
jgi:hypothetical protein